jgi:hypothetical protein
MKVASLACSHVKLPVFVGKTKECLKRSQGLDVIGLQTPFATGFGEHASFDRRQRRSH